MSVPYFWMVDRTIMMNFIESVLCYFESCVSRKVSFRWFVSITIELMLRSDKLGVTSVIRDLALRLGCYDSMLHFFGASSWSLGEIRSRLFSAVNKYAPLYTEDGFHVLVGDSVKQSKEGRRMPGVKKLFQESENFAKPEYIHGHMFVGLGILAGSIKSWACIPLSIRLHDGLQVVKDWKGASVSSASHVVKMVENAYHTARTFGDFLLLLGRHFLTVPSPVLHSRSPAHASPGREDCLKREAAVHLKDLFVSHRKEFQEAEIELYGKKVLDYLRK